MNIYIYCVCAQLTEDSKTFSFKTATKGGLNSRTVLALGTEPSPPRIVFTLGPFLDDDEAKNVESEAQRLLAQYLDGAGLLGTNPLDIPEFLAWIDSQILPVRVRERRRRRERSRARVWRTRKKVATDELRAAAKPASSKSSGSQS